MLFSLTIYLTPLSWLLFYPRKRGSKFGIAKDPMNVDFVIFTQLFLLRFPLFQGKMKVKNN